MKEQKKNATMEEAGTTKPRTDYVMNSFSSVPLTSPPSSTPLSSHTASQSPQRVHWGDIKDDPDNKNSNVGNTLYFRDGIRRIDYVLVYNESKTNDNDSNEKRREKRDEFERRLQEGGIDLEHEPASASPDGKTCYVKLHATWGFLLTQAEALKVRVPLKDQSRRRGVLQDLLDSYFKHNPFKLDQKDIPAAATNYFTAVFDRRYLDQFMYSSQDTFFNSTQRHRMVFDCLLRTGYGKHNCMGINRLIRNGAYETAFPLHEEFSTKKTAKKDRSERQILWDTWASPSMYYKYQPVALIRRYFGEKIAIYFAWLGFYSNALIPAAFAGIVCILYGWSSLAVDVPSHDVCNVEPGGIGLTVMCPNGHVSQGEPWNLSSSCLFSKVTYVFDNNATVGFAIFMSIWVTLFLEFWKRQQATLAWEWDLHDADMEDENVRPEYMIRIKTEKVNPVTGEREPHMPLGQRLLRLFGSAMAILVLLCVVTGFIFGIVVYRMIMVWTFSSWKAVGLPSQGMVLTSITAAILNLIVIIALDCLYQRLAWYLTSWEYPRTELQFEDSYTFKVFLFQFINYYSALFYIAFIKGRFSSVIFAEKHIFEFVGYPAEACDPAGCMVELLIQLAIIMVGKQFLSNAMEIFFPVTFNYLRKWRRKSLEDTKRTQPRWEQDYQLNEVPPLYMFGEYLEMVIQYGFITLFVAAFPLAPLFALINNIIEVRLDAYKFLVACRRPAPARARDLGIWYRILEGISYLAVLTNACVIAFTSDFVPRLLYKYAYSKYENLDGYANHSLSWYDTRRACQNITLGEQHACNVTYCRFRDYRNPPCSLDPTGYCDPNGEYTYTGVWWHVLVARLAFVLVFEHFVFLIKGFIAYIIPDVPRSIVRQIQREHYLARKAMYSRTSVGPGTSDTEASGKEAKRDTSDGTPILDRNVRGGSKQPSVNSDFRYSPGESKESSSDEEIQNKGKLPLRKFRI